MNRALPLTAFAILCVLRPGLPGPPPAPLAPERAVATLMPASCRVYLEGPGLEPLLRSGLAHPFLAAARATPLARALEEAGGSLEQALERADAWLGAPALPLAARMTQRGVALGFDPEHEAGLLIAVASDAAAAEEGLTAIFAALERQHGVPGALRSAHARWDDAEVWFLGEEAVVARRGELSVVGKRREDVRAVLALAADPGARGMLARPDLQAQYEARAPGAVLWAWLAMEELEAFGDEGLRALRRAGLAPAGQGLLGAELAALCGARALALSLALDAEGPELSVRAVGAPHVESLAPGARAAEQPAEVAGEDLGSALLYRDYARFLADRAALFPVEAQAAFAETITTGALFFAGRDLGSEVLPHVSPWIRLVARAVEFAPERRPEITLPAVAAIAVLDDPAEGEAWTSALQTLIAILGVEQAQKGRAGLGLHLSSVDGIELTSARFPAPRPGEGVDLRYNLEPAMTVVGRHLIVGTHVALVRELARELEGKPPLDGPAQEQLRLAPRTLAGLLADNQAALVAHKMLAEGLAHADALEEIVGLERVLESLESVRVEVRRPATDAHELLLTPVLSVAPR